MPQSKKLFYHYLVELPRPTALRKRLVMHFPFEIIFLGYQGILEWHTDGRPWH
jgi:hypothetical protein